MDLINQQKSGNMMLYDVTSVINDGWYMLLGLVLANLLGIMISHIREIFQSINQLVLHEMG